MSLKVLFTDEFGLSSRSVWSALLTNCKMCTKPNSMNNAMGRSECGTHDHQAHTESVVLVCNRIMHAVCFCNSRPRNAGCTAHPLSLSPANPRTARAFLFALLFVICYSLFFQLLHAFCYFEKISPRKSGAEEILFCWWVGSNAACYTLG